MIMEEDWAPILNKDCLFSSAAAIASQDLDEFRLTGRLNEDDCDDMIKTEPAEDSDYQGSSSGSPSSSLSSPDMKADLGVDLTFCVPFHPNHSFLHSPSSSSGSPFGSMFPPCGGAPQTSPLPPVSHFSQQNNAQMSQQQINEQQHVNSLFGTQDTLSFFDDERSPSPPTSDRSSPMDNVPSMMMTYDPLPGTFNGAVMHNGLVMNGLSAAQQQLKSRSKMHEMAVKQRLITDQLQDPRSQGMVQLSAEERRTLVQEGYPVPTRLPLSKPEEEALKIVRRKIKNKLSAQESRRKRKEYMDTLEQRCQGYFSENTQLKGRVRQLEMTNKQMAAQLKKLQEMMGVTGDH